MLLSRKPPGLIQSIPNTPWAVGEAALAHQLGGSVEQAYARSKLFDRRQTLMQQWADYLTT